MESTAYKLLVVDDVADNRELLSRRFTRLGYRTTEAIDGIAALNLISQEKFDLVFLDIMMPGIDGIEVLKIIRTSHSPASLPVIMVTAKAESRDIAEALALGANDYITKPYIFSVVLARTQHQLNMKEAEEKLQLHVRQLGIVNEELQKEIIERQHSEERIRLMTYQDALTGLSNRLQFRERLSAMLSVQSGTPRNIALLYLDLDGFKAVNDAFGHPTGDALLNGVGERLLACVGPDDHVSRLGGDEFAIIQVAAEQPSAAETLSSRLRQAITDPFMIDHRVISVGLSVGIALETDLKPSEDRHIDAFIKKADLALYVAKAEGRSKSCFFNDQMSLIIERRRLIAQQLDSVLDRSELKLYYQPILDAERGSVVAFEALMRWDHPSGEKIPPSEFIPIAEGSGVIHKIGAWALKQACADAIGWPAPIKVAVNLSPMQFGASNLTDLVRETLEQSGLAPDRLEVEITESALLTESESTLTTLNEVRGLGVSTSLDDFGTGFSSLSYLLKFPFDKIKIDQSFVRGLPENKSSLAVVLTIKALADSLGMAVVAEGVETEDQFRQLIAAGCRQIQGYYIGRPIPSAEIPSFLLAQIKSRFHHPHFVSGATPTTLSRRA